MSQPGPSQQAADLQSYLTEQREHVLGAVQNLSEQDMRRAVLPTGWSAAGLVQHLALDVERFWFRRVMTGEEAGPDAFSAPGDNAWVVRPEVSAADVVGLYRREIERADKIIAATAVDTPPAWWPDFFPPSFHLDTLRQVMLHVITETACHAGHLDAARELIDGQTWLVLT